MSIRYRKDRASFFVDIVWPDGIRTRKIMPDKKTAMKIDLQIRASIVDEANIWRKKRKNLGLDGERLQGFSELADKYIADYVMTNNKSPKNKINRIKAIKRYFLTMPICSLTVQHIDGYISARKKQGLKNESINFDIATLKHMFTWAKSRGYIETNPLNEVSLLKKVERVGEHPDESVIDKIFKELAPVNIPIFTFICETGCRDGEAMSLTWDQVNYEKAIVTFHTTTKNGRARQVPLTAAALAALSSMPRHGKIVFYHPDTLKAYSANQIGLAWRRATQKVIVGTGADAHSSRLRIHDLRHAYAIRLAESGCPMHFISEVLGHSSIEFTRKKYARFSPESASQAVLKVLAGGRK